MSNVEFDLTTVERYRAEIRGYLDRQDGVWPDWGHRINYHVYRDAQDADDPLAAEIAAFKALMGPELYMQMGLHKSLGP